jgi:hypothetical protein
MKYQFISDGYIFEADTPRQACERIWHSMKFQFDKSVEDWMLSNAKACEAWCGKKFRTDSLENHFTDLLRHKIIEEIPAD